MTNGNGNEGSAYEPQQNGAAESSADTESNSPQNDGRSTPDPQLLIVLLGTALLICAIVARFSFDTAEHPALLAMLAALCLGTPVTWNTLRGLLGYKSQDQHTEALVMIAFLASFASARYLEAASIALFMYVASLIVHRTATGARRTIESLMRVSPKRANRLREDDTEEDVLATKLNPGDRVIVRPGDQVPCDGRVMSGFSSLDEKYITGESHPVDKSTQDQVFAGSINLTGVLTIEVEKPLAESTLGRVQALILDAANHKTPVAQMLDRFSGYYMPVVLCLAGIVLFFTQDMSRVISLLLIACPMEIIISGPLAAVASLSAAARLGVLIKNVTDIEVARNLTAIVFDKTGTLTTGNLAVTRLFPAEDADPADLLNLAGSLEQNSRHPVARAVVAISEKAKVELSPVDGFEEVAGRGVRGTVNGRQVMAGRESWVRESGVDIPEGLLDEAGALSVLLVAEQGRCLGWIGLSDQNRGGAATALEELSDLGIKQRIMVTGDRRGPAQQTADTLDLTEVVAEALPGDKLDIVRQLKERGHTVAVIGDGVNDGPALAAADISVAMGAAGSDVAINAASIALMNSQLNRLPFLVRLSRATNRVIRQNIVFILLYILTMLVLLGAGYVTPFVAAVSHGFSSVFVIFNSARLIRQGEDLPLLEEIERSRSARSAQSGQRVQTLRVADPSTQLVGTAN
ncbi:MAG: cation-translocating P-type ATPase [Planctomycetota bacterium]